MTNCSGWGRQLAWLGVIALFSGQANALGLNAAAGVVVLGQPVRLTIPVELGEGKFPDAACFRLL